MMRFMRGAAIARKKPTAGRRRASGRFLAVAGSPRTRATLRDVHDRLLAAYGRQRWWPGDSKFEIMVGAVLTQNTAWTNVERAIANLKQAKALSPVTIVAAH